jgi:hypothetical protein
MPTIRPLFLLLAVAILVPAADATVVLNPGDTLEFQFTVNPIFFGGYTPDALTLDTEAGSQVVPITLELSVSNGTTLLASSSADLSWFGSRSFPDWQLDVLGGPGAPSWFPSGDFTSIVNGTIIGRLDLTVTAGQFTLNDPSEAELELWALSSDGGGNNLPFALTVTNIEFDPAGVPEPASAALLIPALAGLAVLRRRFGKG